MIEKTSELRHHSADVSCPAGHFHVEKFLYCQAVGQLVAHGGDVIETIEVVEALQVVSVFDVLFAPPMEETDVGVQRPHYLKNKESVLKGETSLRFLPLKDEN